MSENTGYAIYFIDETGHYHPVFKKWIFKRKKSWEKRKARGLRTAGNVFYMSEKLENIDAKLLTIKVEPLFGEKIGQKEQYKIRCSSYNGDIYSDNLHNYFLCGGKDAAQNLHPS